MKKLKEVLDLKNIILLLFVTSLFTPLVSNSLVHLTSDVFQLVYNIEVSVCMDSNFEEEATFPTIGTWITLGRYRPSIKEIWVKPNLPAFLAVKVALHELRHAWQYQSGQQKVSLCRELPYWHRPIEVDARKFDRIGTIIFVLIYAVLFAFIYKVLSFKYSRFLFILVLCFCFSSIQTATSPREQLGAVEGFFIRYSWEEDGESGTALTRVSPEKALILVEKERYKIEINGGHKYIIFDFID